MKRLALALLWLAGCSAGGSNAGTSQCTPPACPFAGLPLAVEIAPPSTRTDVVNTEVSSVVLDENGQWSIALTAPVMLSGRVTVGNAGKAQFLSGTVVATRPSRIAGRPDISYQTALDVGDGTYSLAVSPTLPGEQYTIRILSSDTSTFPPQTFQISDVTGAQVGFDLVLDDPTQLTQVAGVVTDPLGNPIPGLQVQAINPATKAVVSTTTTTDGGGTYSIRLSKSVAKLSPPTVTLMVTPTNNASVGTPSLQLPVDVSQATQGAITRNLQAPPLPATAQFGYHVSGVGSSGAETPVVGAQVKFTAMVTNPSTPLETATFTATGQTDTDGNVMLSLIPAAAGQATRDYQVSVAPPSTSDFQGTTTTLSVGPTGGYGAPIELQLRPLLSGRVVDTLGQAVRSVTVQPGPATVAMALDATSLADVMSADSTMSGPDGRFAVRLDPGSYDVALLPLASTRLPRRWLDRLAVTSDVDVGDVLLPTATMATLTILDENGAPLVNAAVQLYTLASGNVDPSCTTLACLSPPRLAAEGTTGTDGNVPLLLPAATNGVQ